MPKSTDTVRRWCGVVFLILAAGLLAAGQFVLKDALINRGKIAFLLYWGACFFFTVAAMVVALLDMRATRRKACEEQAELLQRSFGDVREDDAPEAGKQDEERPVR
jgi:hypothetical protein